MKKQKPVLFILLFSGIILLIFLIMQPAEICYAGDIAMLFPKGLIALRERNLLFIVQAIMLIVVIPVYFLTFLFSWKYRAHNSQAKYTPEWDDDRLAEYIWWGLPCAIVAAMSVLTWIETHRLDPYKPLISDKKPLTIQVVALQWKWLFIYPEHEIATVNFFQFPEKTPLHFIITADAPMNSFWIPQLGGQIYAMPNMRTELHLIADTTGEFKGASANLSGRGFSGMRFVAKATSEEDFTRWVSEAKQSTFALDLNTYNELAMPSENSKPTTYVLKEEKLFDHVLMKFMHPTEIHEK